MASIRDFLIWLRQFYPNGKTKGIKWYLQDIGPHPHWCSPPTLEDYEEWFKEVFKSHTYTEKDLKNMGMNVKREGNGEPYLDTPYGKCYLKNEPGYRGRQWQV